MADEAMMAAEGSPSEVESAVTPLTEMPGEVAAYLANDGEGYASAYLPEYAPEYTPEYASDAVPAYAADYLPEEADDYVPEAETPELDEEALRCLPLAETEYQRLLRMGYQDSDETRAAAWSLAQQQDAVIQQTVAARMQEQLAPYAEAIAPTLFAHEISGVLDSAPVYGVDAQALAQEIAQAGIPPSEWMSAPAAMKEQFILAAAKQVAYQRFLNGELAPPQAGYTAPAQRPPAGLRGDAGLHTGNPVLEQQIAHLVNTMGLSRDTALGVLRGEG